MKPTTTKIYNEPEGSIRQIKRHNIRIKKLIGFAGLLVLLTMAAGCKKLLQEKPESSIVPSIFNTEGGLVGGVGGVYNDLRSLWGTEGFTMQCLGGTDETQEGASVTSPD